MRYRLALLMALGLAADSLLGCYGKTAVEPASNLETKIEAAQPAKKTINPQTAQPEKETESFNYKRLDLFLENEEYRLIPAGTEQEKYAESLPSKNERFDRFLLSGSDLYIENTKKALELIKEKDLNAYNLVKESFSSIIDDGRFGVCIIVMEGFEPKSSLLLSSRQYLGATPDYARLIVGAATKTELTLKGYDKKEIEKKASEAEDGFRVKVK